MTDIMPVEQQTISCELAKQLKELGVKQKSLFFWTIPKKTKEFPWIYYSQINNSLLDTDFYESCSSFSAAELGELLPNHIILKDGAPFDNYRISITKFYSINDNNQTQNNYIINYECDSCETHGENAFLKRKLTKNIYDPNLANAMARMLIFLIENESLFLHNGKNKL